MRAVRAALQSSWPCAAALERRFLRRRTTGGQGIVSCRRALDGFRDVWCAACRSARRSCERRTLITEWPALWQSLVAEGAIPDPNDPSDRAKLIPVAEALLTKYAHQAEAQTELVRPLSTLWQAAQTFWQGWLSAAYQQPQPLPGDLCSRWLDAAGIVSDDARKAALAALASVVNPSTAPSSPSVEHPSVPAALTSLLVRIQNRIGVEADGEPLTEEKRREIAERELRISVGRLRFERMRLALQVEGAKAEVEDAEHEPGETEEEETEEVEDEGSARDSPRLGGRQAKGRARLQLLQPAIAGRKRRRSHHEATRKLAKHAPVLAELVGKALRQEPDPVDEECLVEECVKFLEEADKAEAMLMGAGRWLVSNTTGDTATTLECTQKSQRMAKLRDHSRPLVDASKELRSLLPELAVSERTRKRLQEVMQ